MSNQNSESSYDLYILLAVVVTAGLFGNLIGIIAAGNQCDDRLDNIQEMCIMTSNDAFDFCRETMDQMDDQCMNENPSAQQSRIHKWEECFRDENCRNCLLMTEEAWKADVEWCHAGALHSEEPLPDYVPPPEYEPELRGPNL